MESMTEKTCDKKNGLLKRAEKKVDRYIIKIEKEDPAAPCTAIRRWMSSNLMGQIVTLERDLWLRSTDVRVGRKGRCVNSLYR